VTGARQPRRHDGRRARPQARRGGAELHLDFPEVIAARQQLLPARRNAHGVGADLTERFMTSAGQLDVVVDQLEHGVQVLGVEQVEVPPHEGQVVLDAAFTRLQMFLGGSSGHHLHLQLWVERCSLVSPKHRVQASRQHRGQRQSPITAGRHRSR
jgi:hypothetical protein